jgi:hypothetical protein
VLLLLLLLRFTLVLLPLLLTAAGRTCAPSQQHTHIVALYDFAYQRQDCPVMYVLVGGSRPVAVCGLKLVFPAL